MFLKKLVPKATSIVRSMKNISKLWNKFEKKTNAFKHKSNRNMSHLLAFEVFVVAVISECITVRQISMLYRTVSLWLNEAFE